MSLSKKIISYLFNRAGISADESEPADIIVHDSSFYRDVLTKCSLGLGDSYIEGKWDSANIDKVIFRILSSGIYQKIGFVYDLFREIKSRAVNLQNREGSKKVIKKHYDLPVEIYAAFLDPYFQYTCAFFEGTSDLKQAQINKMDLICQKLALKEGDRVMDVGGGWGGLAKFMADNYIAKPVVVTLSNEQANYIKKTHGEKIEVWLCDYRDIPTILTEQFDAVSAVGVLEHIGHKNYSTFMEIISQGLKNGGRFLLHTLYTLCSRPEQNPWVEKHIFPNSELPPIGFIRSSTQSFFKMVTGGQGFQELTSHYNPTLIAWNNNLNRAIESGDVKMPEMMHRKFQHYFLSYAGAFQAEYLRVGQFLYEKNISTSLDWI
jgi:cyclopropane-fatty-acyl-phospholipid synthase